MDTTKNRQGGIGLSIESKRKVDTHLKSFFAYLLFHGKIKDNPCATIEVKKQKKPEVNTFKKHEVDEILCYAKEKCPDKIYLFFKTAESTGMRDSEICGMTTEYRWKNISLSERIR